MNAFTQASAADFSAAYVAVRQVAAQLETCPEAADRDTVEWLKSVLGHPAHAHQKKAFFLYREAAQGLMHVAGRAGNSALEELATRALREATRDLLIDARLAAAEAMAAMPMRLTPSPSLHMIRTVRSQSWPDLAEAFGITGTPPVRMGRSIIFPLSGECVRQAVGALVCKTARNESETEALFLEAAWLRALPELKGCPVRFDLPLLVPQARGGLLELANGPAGTGGLRVLCFLAPKGYFVYPNDPDHKEMASSYDLEEVFFRSACIFAWLLARGISHTAPIPLFHNRSQQHRRDDRGEYLWHRMGRLDQWLESCFYPNFGMSGVRDYEHLAQLPEHPRALFRAAGAHIFGMSLVAGSVFRMREPSLRGRTTQGDPADARHLFDAHELSCFLKAVVKGYHLGFTGRPVEEDTLLVQPGLVERMIEELGVDRHMEEILRAEDQVSMDEETFRRFAERAAPHGGQAVPRRGAADMVVLTGPHLGAFNRKSSLPELCGHAASAAGFCLSARSFAQQLS